MITLILCENNPEKVKVLRTYFKTEIGAEVVNTQSSKETIDYITEGNKVDIVICRNKFDEEEPARIVLNFLYDNNNPTPVLVLGPIDVSGIKYTSLEDKVSLKTILDNVINILQIDKEKIEDFKLPDHIPIPIDHFFNMSTCICDVFLQMKKGGEFQYIKRIAANQEFDKEGILRYKGQGLEELFIKKEFRHEFMESLMTQSLERLKQEGLTMDQLVEYTADSFNTNHELIRTLGITPQTLRMANGVIESMEDQVRKSTTFGPILRALLKNESSYGYRHSELISLLSIQIIPYMDWGSKDFQVQGAFEKMVFVSYFHDMALTKEEHIKIHDKITLFKSKLPDEEKELVLNHANKAATLVQEIKGAPVGVDLIIKQHHGTGNGLGFTENFGRNISPMAIVFVVLEDFVDSLLHFKERGLSIVEIFNNLDKKYKLPSYKRVVETLKDAVIRRA